MVSSPVAMVVVPVVMTVPMVDVPVVMTVAMVDVPVVMNVPMVVVPIVMTVPMRFVPVIRLARACGRRGNKAIDDRPGVDWSVRSIRARSHDSFLTHDGSFVLGYSRHDGARRPHPFATVSQ